MSASVNVFTRGIAVASGTTLDAVLIPSPTGRTSTMTWKSPLDP